MVFLDSKNQLIYAWFSYINELDLISYHVNTGKKIQQIEARK